MIIYYELKKTIGSLPLNGQKDTRKVKDYISKTHNKAEYIKLM